jgi:hypothetical protein
MFHMLERFYSREYVKNIFLNTLLIMYDYFFLLSPSFTKLLNLVQYYVVHLVSRTNGNIFFAYNDN